MKTIKIKTKKPKRLPVVKLKTVSLKKSLASKKARFSKAFK